MERRLTFVVLFLVVVDGRVLDGGGRRLGASVEEVRVVNGGTVARAIVTTGELLRAVRAVD